MPEPPIVNLATVLPPLRPVREAFPDLADRADAMGVELRQDGKRRIFADRGLAREVVAARGDVSPTGAVYIDLREVEGVTPSFVDELLKHWPHAQPIGANPDVQISWDLAVEHRPLPREKGASS